MRASAGWSAWEYACQGYIRNNGLRRQDYYQQQTNAAARSEHAAAAVRSRGKEDAVGVDAHPVHHEALDAAAQRADNT